MIKYNNEQLRELYQQHNKANVPFSIFVSRLKNLNWGCERAGGLTYTPRHNSKTQEHLAIYEHIEDPSVDFDVFNRRMSNGESVTEALSVCRVNRNPLQDYYKNYKNPAVSYHRFVGRVNVSGWDKDKAISTPSTRQKKTTTKIRSKHRLVKWYTDNQERCTVSWAVFIKRVRTYNWDKERALTTPSGSLSHSQLRAFYNAHPSPAVSYVTFRSRVVELFWSKETAISEKPKTPPPRVMEYKPVSTPKPKPKTVTRRESPVSSFNTQHLSNIRLF